jgi:hypothetical protein
MKKALMLTFAVLLMGAVSAAAQTPQPATTQAQTGTAVGPNFVDANGDGICDLYQSGTRPGRTGAGRRGYGPGDGTGTGVGPRDGSGYGPGGGSGLCDGTGPKGARGRGRR